MPDVLIKTDRESLRSGVRIRSGLIYKIAVRRPPGIANLRWSAESCQVGDGVRLMADVQGSPSGAVRFSIFEFDHDGKHDLVAELEGTLEAGQAVADWEATWEDDRDDASSAKELAEKGYTLPEYFFAVSVGEVQGPEGKESERLLRVSDLLDFKVEAPEGTSLEGRGYTLVLSDGSQRDGTLDATGHLREEGVVPGPYFVNLWPPA